MSDCALNYKIISLPDHECVEPLEFEIVTVAENSLSIEPKFSNSHPIGESMEILVVQSGRGAARNVGNLPKISLNPVIDSVSLADANGDYHMSTKGGSRLTITGRGFDSDRIISISSPLCTVESFSSTEIVCTTLPANHGSVVKVEFVYQLSDCKGGSVGYTLTSDISFTADDSLDLSVDVDASGVTGNSAKIMVNCQAKCQELLTSLQAGEFDLEMKQGVNSTIDITGVTFSLANLDTIQVDFTVGAYSKG